MKRGRRFEGGVICLLIFILTSSPVLTSTSAFNMAFAATRQAIEPEGAPSAAKISDPYEHSNRAIFEFNDRLYFGVLKPVTRVYSFLFPLQLREAIYRGFHNLVFPSRFINFMLQGKADKAANEAARFLINSTMGAAGLFDVAQAVFRLENYEADFGQTLALWGLRSGDFLMVPVLGPSDPRDLFGYAVDSAMDPLYWVPAVWWVTFCAQSGKFTNYTSLHGGEYEELKKASLDPYIAARDAYIQYRKHLISK